LFHRFPDLELRSSDLSLGIDFVSADFGYLANEKILSAYELRSTVDQLILENKFYINPY
jgi:hypothetical protein